MVLDCTDHPTSRYLISDIAVLLGKPLVSASALRTDGQLIVLNCPPAPPGSSSSSSSPGVGGPCYRCIFPWPPPPESVVGCGEGGVLGPVVGAMGVLQALETIRMIASGRHVLAPDGEPQDAVQPVLYLFSAGGDLQQPLSLRNARMRRRRREGCFACGEASTLTLESLASGSVDYVRFCGGPSLPVDLLSPEERVSVTEYARVRDAAERHLLLDVRERELFDLGSIDGAVNVPFSKIQSDDRRNGASAAGSDGRSLPGWMPPGLLDDQDHSTPVYVVCRVGNDSQLVARKLKDQWHLDRNGARFVGDIRGGMRGWKAEVDDTMPFA